MLILGETGTGKDTLARALHQEGGRAERAYVAFNCAAVPETLIDSELFGYGVGAFTGARREGSPGRLIEADGGTLFLDEIGDMPLVLQTRLLRVLESGEVSPLGSGKTRTIDVQIIAATNQNLKTRVAQGLFREDLYYRLAGVVIQLQPLRDREDFAQLARRMLDRVAGGEDVGLSDEALARLARHRWPGNARELKFVLQRAAQICEGGWIRPEDLMLDDEVPRGPESAVPDCAPRPAPTARDEHPCRRAHRHRRCAGEMRGRCGEDGGCVEDQPRHALSEDAPAQSASPALRRLRPALTAARGHRRPSPATIATGAGSGRPDLGCRHRHARRKSETGVSRSVTTPPGSHRARRRAGTAQEARERSG